MHLGERLGCGLGGRLRCRRLGDRLGHHLRHRRLRKRHLGLRPAHVDRSAGRRRVERVKHGGGIARAGGGSGAGRRHLGQLAVEPEWRTRRGRHVLVHQARLRRRLGIVCAAERPACRRGRHGRLPARERGGLGLGRRGLRRRLRRRARRGLRLLLDLLLNGAHEAGALVLLAQLHALAAQRVGYGRTGRLRLLLRHGVHGRGRLVKRAGQRLVAAAGRYAGRVAARGIAALHLELPRTALELLLGLELLVPLDDFVDALLVAVHLQHAAHLGQGHVLPVAEADDLVKRLQDLEARQEDVVLVQRVALVAHRAGQEMQRVNVLQDVGVLRRDEDHVQILKRLVYVAHRVRLHRRVLRVRGDELRERRQQRLDPRAGHLPELAGNHRCILSAPSRTTPPAHTLATTRRDRSC